MKKYCAAATTALALAVPATGAAFEPDVDLYGAVNLGVYGHGGDLADDNEGVYLPSHFSRLGVRGEHTLANGLTVMGQLEGGVAANAYVRNTEGSGGFCNETRDSWVGLKGDFGTVQAGVLPLANRVVYDAHLFVHDPLSDAATLTSGGLVTAARNQSLWYQTPSMGGFTLGLQVIPDGQREDFGFGVRGAYRTDTLTVALSHYDVSGGTAGSSDRGDGAGNRAGVADTTLLQTSWDYGMGRLVAGVTWIQESDSDAAGTLVYEDDSMAWTLGASYRLGAHTAKVQVSGADDDHHRAAGDDPLLVAAGYTIPLGDAADLNFGVAYAQNSTVGTWGWGHNLHGNGDGQPAGVDPQGDVYSAGTNLHYRF